MIPCRKIDRFAMECVSQCAKLDYEKFEIILLPDIPGTLDDVKVVPTGPVLPGRKRNIGASVATGEILAYIDDDAYPRLDWLSNAVRHLQGRGVGAVGGPAITPPEDGSLCQAQGYVLSSFLAVGTLSARYKESRIFETDDIHSVNLVAWKKVLQEVGGWNEKYWPGEDTLLCLGIRKAGYRQLLASDVVVYHHRRPMLRLYLRQISNYGLHRGYFSKRFPDNSRRASYFIPSIILLGLVVGPIIVLAVPSIWWVFLGALSLYAVLIAFAAVRSKHFGFIVFIMIPLTHLAYGVGFIRGLLAERLTR